MKTDTKEQFLTALVPTKEHKEIRKMAVDLDISARNIYEEVVPLGLAAYKEQLKLNKSKVAVQENSSENQSK